MSITLFSAINNLFPQSQYRILVEIVNENDNRPNFLQDTIQPFTFSEVNMEAFVVLMSAVYVKSDRKRNLSSNPTLFLTYSLLSNH